MPAGPGVPVLCWAITGAALARAPATATHISIIDLVFKATEEVRIEAPQEERESDQLPGKKQPKFTPVTFRPACIDRLQRFLKETLVRQSAAIFATPDGLTAALSATSRPYGKGDRTGYWFAFHPHQKETLRAYRTAWVTFGCGSEKNLLMIPFKEFITWLPRFHQTHLADRFYWHVRVRHGENKWHLIVKRGAGSIDVTKYLLQ
jgi:hypothetical protein